MRRPPSRALAGVIMLTGLLSAAERGATAADKPSAAPHPDTIFVFGTEFNASARLTFMMPDRQPSLTVRQVGGGVEVRSNDAGAFELVNFPQLREVVGVDVRKDGDAGIAVIRLSGNYQVQEQDIGNKVRLDLVETTPTAEKKPEATAPQAKAPVEPAAPAQQAPTQQIAQQAKISSELDALRNGLTEKLSLLKVPPPRAATTATPPDAPIAASQRTASAEAAQGPRPSCPARFSMEGWKGDGAFPERLRALRIQAAQSEEQPSAMAALAEFYLGYGLGGEALVVAEEARLDGISSEDRQRLQRDADLARLLKGRPIAATSYLLSGSKDCDQTDTPLWRALAAAAGNDQETIRRDSEAAGYALQFIPDPLSSLLAFRIAEAAPDNLPVLRAMAAAVRNSDLSGPVDGGGRFLLQARIARAQKDTVDEANYLERVTHDIGITGLKAKVRLAELRSSQDDKEGHQSELILADAARVFRDNAFGQSAAAALSERRLAHGDYAGALQVANDSAAGRIQQHGDSRGAVLAAQALRRLLVQKDVPDLPPPEQRILIFWRYGGYATPGEKGDDIRMGAAQLMLDRDMPEAALDVMRQVTVQSPHSAFLRALAEARGGDPEAALALSKGISPDDGQHRVASEALARLGRKAEAAHQLDGSKDPSDEPRRAALLYEAKEWSDAATAYASVLHNPLLAKDARDAAADRYALALALSGKHPAKDIQGFTGLADHVLGALPPEQAAPSAPISAIRGSLQRAGRIEALLPPAGGPAPANGG